MRLGRRDHLGARGELPAGGMVGPRDDGVQVRGVGAAAGLEAEGLHSRQIAEVYLERMQYAENTLERGGILSRVHGLDLRVQQLVVAGRLLLLLLFSFNSHMVGVKEAACGRGACSGLKTIK